MSNLVINSKRIVINTAKKTAKHFRYLSSRTISGSMPASPSSAGRSQNAAKFINFINNKWNKFKNCIEKIKDKICPERLTNKGLNVKKHNDDDVSKIVKKSIGNKPYRIATAGYSYKTEGYEEVTRTFLKSIDASLGSKNTGYVFPPTLDKGSIYGITSQVSGLKKDKALFLTAEEFFTGHINPENFYSNVNMKEYKKIPIHVFKTPEMYTKATANASNVLVCTGGRQIAVREIIQAIKRKNKVVLLHNLNLNNGTYNALNDVENAARYFDEMRLSKMLKCSKAERRELAELLKDRDKINELVRVYLVNDSKSAAEAGIRAAKFIRNAEQVVSKLQLPNITEVKTMTISQLREVAKIPDGFELMIKAGVIIPKPETSVYNSIYGTIKHSQIKTTDGQIVSSSLIVPLSNDKAKNILKNIPQNILETQASEHIHKIKWSTINPKVGVIVTQNQSKPIIVRKIITEGSLENSLVSNNLHNIPLRYDMVKETQYIDTYSGRQALTGDGFMAIYSSPAKKQSRTRSKLFAKSGNKKITNSAKAVSEDHSFMPRNIADKQYEIILPNGKRIPCNYNEMSSGVDYTISKKTGVELKMAVPSREVISSEGEILPPNKLYMVDSNGHFYDGNPILRIKRGDINWNADMKDAAQAKIINLIDESLRLEAKAATAKQAGNNELSNKLMRQAEKITAEAEQKMTDWVKSIQNKNNVAFFI